MIGSSYPEFDRLIKCRYYCLMHTCHVSLAEESEKLFEEVMTFQATFDNATVNEGDPNLVFDLFAAFFKDADTFGVSKAHAFLAMPKHTQELSQKASVADPQ